MVWKVCKGEKKLEKLVGLGGHQSRVLYLSISPDGRYVVSGAGDETLRFWDLGYKETKINMLPTGVFCGKGLR